MAAGLKPGGQAVLLEAILDSGDGDGAKPDATRALDLDAIDLLGNVAAPRHPHRAIGFLMTRHDVNDNAPFLGVLPAFSVGTQQFAVNLTYLPGQFAERMTGARTADPNLDGILFIQFKINARLFGFGGSQDSERLAANTAN